MSSIYLLIHNEAQGPYSEEQVRQKLAEGKITNDVFAWKEGLEEWVAVSELLEGLEPTPQIPSPQPLGSVDEVDKQIALLKDKNEKVRFYAVKALDALGDKRAVEPLIACLKDQNSQVRFIAAKTLGNMGDARAVEPLKACLKDQDEKVRNNAAEALRTLGISPGTANPVPPGANAPQSTGGGLNIGGVIFMIYLMHQCSSHH